MGSQEGFWWAVRWTNVALPFALSVDPRWQDASFQIGPLLIGYCWGEPK